MSSRHPDISTMAMICTGVLCDLIMLPIGTVPLLSLIALVMQDDVLLAYQLCFDLFENESQAFNFKVRASSWRVLAYKGITVSLRRDHCPMTYISGCRSGFTGPSLGFCAGHRASRAVSAKAPSSARVQWP